jgi:hypothetical protein
LSSEKSRSCIYADTGEVLAIPDILMTFSLNHDDPWVAQKLAYIEGAVNPAQFYVPKQLDLSA